MAPEQKLVTITRQGGGKAVTAYANLGEEDISLDPVPGKVIFNSEAPRYGGRAGEKAAEARQLLRGQFLVIEQG